MLRVVCSICLAAILAGCGSDAVDVDLRPVLGAIGFFHDPILVSAPDSVDAGVEFGVSMRTYGGGCHREGPTEVDTVGGRVVVSAYDLLPTNPNLACPEVLQTFDHETGVTLKAPGRHVVAFRGLLLPDSTEMTVERVVIVR